MRDLILRLLNLLAVLGAAAWLARAPGWDALVSFLALFSAMIGQEVSLVRKSKTNDRVLFEKFLSEFPSNGPSAYFLREHDIAGPFRNEELKELNAFLNNWDNAEHEFMHPTLELQRKKLFELAQKFRYELAMNVSGDDHARDFLTMNLRREGYPPDRMKIKNDLNKMASQVYFEHQCARNIRSSREGLDGRAKIPNSRTTRAAFLTAQTNIRFNIIHIMRSDRGV